MERFERQIERLRSINPLIIDGVVAGVFTLLGVASVFGQEVKGALVEPDAFAAFTAIVTCAPIVIRRRAPLVAVTAGCTAILVHIGADYPEGSLPLALLFLTYTVGTSSRTKHALAGLGVVYLTILLLAFSDAPGLDALGTLGNFAFFSVAWAIGFALRSRRETLEVRVREAEERVNVERESTARVLAEERLRIAQELHDVVAHSMSVIAVQAGVGAHVLADRPDQARVALEAISATSRGTLTEMRRLLGVLRDGDGQRSHAPAPGLSDLPQLVDEVRAAGVPVTLHVEGSNGSVNAGVELSAYRVVQEALTNVIKHAGVATRVDVNLDVRPGSLAIEIVDDGRGAAALAPGGDGRNDGGPQQSGHGLVGMRERVELWGGDLSVGPVTGGGYRVKALLPLGAPE